MMTREYKSLPKNGTVETPFGTMAVRFMCDGDHPTVTLDGSADGAFITVNGIKVAATLTLTDYGNGFELRKDSRDNNTRHALYATRFEPKGSGSAMFEVSAVAKRKIRDTLPAIAVEWAKGREKLFVIARRVAVNNDIHRLQTELADIEEKAEDLKRQIADKEERYAAISHPVLACVAYPLWRRDPTLS